MAPNKDIFSKAAIDKQRSPENIDKLLQVTTPISWIGLAALGMMIFSLLMWSIFGAIVDKVEGTGILLDAGGVANVSSVVGGKVERVLVAPGTQVRKGDVIAYIERNAE